MQEGQPTYDQLYQIIGSIYSDAYLRIKFLETENKTLHEDRQVTVASLKASLDSLRKEHEILKSKHSERSEEWNNGNGNCMLPASLQEKSPSVSTD